MSLYDVALTLCTVSIPYWVAFLAGETRRRLLVGHWR